MTRGNLSPRARVHIELSEAVRAQRPSEEVDALLLKCPDAECSLCGEIVCPHGSSWHFHHDGCPACAENEK